MKWRLLWIPRRRSLEQTANCQTCWQSVDAKRVAIHAAFGEGHQAILSGFFKKHIKIRKKHDSVLHQKQNWPITPTKFKGLSLSLIWICTKVKGGGSILKCDMFMTPTFCQVKLRAMQGRHRTPPLQPDQLAALELSCSIVWGGFLLVTFFLGGEKNVTPLAG